MRAVWRRDEGRCAFVGSDGKRCGSTHQLEFGHIIASAKGGGYDVADLRLLCRAHNQYEARRDFGAALMAKYARTG